jgi:hypothetical protein
MGEGRVPAKQAGAAGITKERLDMDSGGFNWTLLTIVGPALLAIVILWALLKNRGTSRAELDRTEQATHNLYKEEEAERRSESDKEH